MRSLYESISSVIDDQVVIQNTIDRNSIVIDKILNARSEFPMMRFLEENNLRLDKDNVKKIVNKLKKALPEGALFGYKYGVPQIAKQIVVKYDTVKNAFTTPRYAYYKIEIEYAIRNSPNSYHMSQTEMEEFLVYLTEDYIYALDIPETKSILAELDDHFSKYTTQDEVKLTATYKLKSKIGGKYRVYSFKDLIKEFIGKH